MGSACICRATSDAFLMSVFIFTRMSTDDDDKSLRNLPAAVVHGQEQKATESIAAQLSAENILENNLLEHEGEILKYRIVKNSDGTLLYLDLNGNEIKYGSYFYIAKRLVLQWMNSPPHRANILDNNLRLLGCSCAVDETKVPVMIRCTQNFGTIK